MDRHTELMSNSYEFAAASTTLVAPRKSSGFAVASLVLGLVAALPIVLLVLSGSMTRALLFSIFLLLPAILAVVFGHVGSARARRHGDNRTAVGMSRWGLTLGWIVVAFWPVAGVLSVFSRVVGG